MAGDDEWTIFAKSSSGTYKIVVPVSGTVDQMWFYQQAAKHLNIPLSRFRDLPTTRETNYKTYTGEFRPAIRNTTVYYE